jgi:hypothetical protein
VKAKRATADLKHLRRELERFVSEAQSLPGEAAVPVQVYVARLKDILRKHMESGAKRT